MKINKTGFWEDMTINDINIEHAFDINLCNDIKIFLKDENTKSVVDLGCGLGKYTNELKKIVQTCDGFDGNPSTKELTNGECDILDLSKTHVFDNKYDWVLSLEVGEHIPKEYENIFIDNLCNNCINGIIISWAIEGQPGAGHVNCQNNEYIIDKIESKGFEYDLIASENLRHGSSLWWFKKTIMIFRKVK